MTAAIALAESGWVPDTLVRAGIRRLVRQRLTEELKQPSGTHEARIQALRESPVALHTDAANAQHYELPTAFFQDVLGPRMKYSACIFPDQTASLAEAELHTLSLYEQHLGVADGHHVLDLGCGWGSFSLWLAEHRPKVTVTAVSNSASQRQYIESEAARKGLRNVNVITADVNDLSLPAEQFDRAISVEMFEHVRNYQVLMERIGTWLKPNGALFTHIFCHKDLIYPFETEGDDNWMGRYFFTGGLMPSASTLSHFQDHMQLQQSWLYDGSHYERTARAWLHNMDHNATTILPILSDTYGIDQASKWRQRWRMFFMACEEMFAYDQGKQWQVAHYLFRKTT